MESFKVTRANTVYVYSEPVRMGKAFKGLSDLVQKEMKRKVMSGDLYMFFNKKRTYVKILFWDKTGLCIFAKQLPGQYYDLEGIEGSTISVKEMQKHLTIVQRKNPLLIEHKGNS